MQSQEGRALNVLPVHLNICESSCMFNNSCFGCPCMRDERTTHYSIFSWVHQFVNLQESRLLNMEVLCDGLIERAVSLPLRILTPCRTHIHTHRMGVWGAEWYVSALSGWCLWKVLNAALQFCSGSSIKVKQQMEFKNLKTSHSLTMFSMHIFFLQWGITHKMLGCVSV